MFKSIDLWLKKHICPTKSDSSIDPHQAVYYVASSMDRQSRQAIDLIISQFPFSCQHETDPARLTAYRTTFVFFNLQSKRSCHQIHRLYGQQMLTDAILVGFKVGRDRPLQAFSNINVHVVDIDLAYSITSFTSEILERD